MTTELFEFAQAISAKAGLRGAPKTGGRILVGSEYDRQIAPHPAGEIFPDTALSKHGAALNRLGFVTLRRTLPEALLGG